VSPTFGTLSGAAGEASIQLFSMHQLKNLFKRSMFLPAVPADEAQDFVFTVFFAGGHYLYPIHLEPRATSMSNMSELIENQLPDSEAT